MHRQLQYNIMISERRTLYCVHVACWLLHVGESERVFLKIRQVFNILGSIFKLQRALYLYINLALK
jgi:hypothetical protein